ncbi:hypothetical protein HWV62_19267 [Athelia sp. TMB]|nr:hypothetical protein HWV62_19267 [Athelia sp. TMB]
MSGNSLRRQQSFLFDAQHDRYKCTIGCDRNIWMRLSHAIRHEETYAHRALVNELNDMPVVPTSPISPGQAALDLPEYCSSPLPRSSPPLYPDDDIPAFHTSAGPYLPEDNPNEIFDDYSSPYNAPVPLRTECEVSAFGEDEEQTGSDSEPENFEGEGEYGDDAESFPAVEGGSAAGDKARTGTGGSNEMNIGTAEARADLEDKSTATDSIQTRLDENVVHSQARRAVAEAYFGPSSEVEDLTEAWSLIDDWWPWATCEEALLDIMHAFPRSVFSETELEATLWFTSKCGVQDLPTIRQVKFHRERVLEQCGVSPKLIEGKHGNLFALNDFAKIIAHEMANPLVRKHMHFFGEDAGPKLKEAWQANRWKDEVSASISGPMVRHDGKDYFVNEPALVNIGPLGEYCPVLPTRFFQRNGQDWAKIHYLRQHPTGAVGHRKRGRYESITAPSLQWAQA